MYSSAYRLIGLLMVTLTSAAACRAGQQVHQTPPSPSTLQKMVPTKKRSAMKATPVVYECPDCHDKFTEAQAKKAGLKCACCQTKLVHLKPSKTAKSNIKKS